MHADVVGDIDYEEVKTGDYVLVLEGKIGKIPSYSIGKIVSQEEEKYKVLYLKRLVPFLKFTRTDQIFTFDRASIKMNIGPLPFTDGTMFTF
jgi:hypothetical protein